jgi:hypothetical protein
MKIVITESQYNLLVEQQLPFPTNPEMDKVILQNKKYFGMPLNTQITPQYTKKVNNFLKKKNVSPEERTFLGATIGLIPIIDEFLDYSSIIKGIIKGDKATLNTGVIGLEQPFAGKALTNLFDYFSEKTMGKKYTDNNVSKRENIVNMTDNERIKLFQKYGYGGYDKWVKDGKPKL